MPVIGFHCSHEQIPQWRTNVFSPPMVWDLETVEQFDRAAADVGPENVRKSVLVSAELGQQVAWLRRVRREDSNL